MPALTITDLNNGKIDMDHIGAIANSPALTALDRLGTTKKTIAGVIAELNYQAAITETGVNRAAAGVSAGLAIEAKTAAESARDASFVTGPKYATEALGRAAVADGVVFMVQGASGIAAYEYRRVNSGSSTPIATYPAAGFQRYMGLATPAMSPQVITDNCYLAVTPGTYTNFSGLIVKNEVAYLRYNGASWVKESIVGDFLKPSLQLGGLVQGWVEPVLISGSGATSVWGMQVSPNTKVRINVLVGAGASRESIITLAPGTFNLNITYGAVLGYVIYCDYAGNLSCVDGPVPAGNYVLLFYCQNSAYLPHFAAFLPTNSYKSVLAGGSIFKEKFIDVSEIDAKAIGAIGNGIADDSAVLNRARIIAEALGKQITLYFPAGTYLFPTQGTGYGTLQYIGDIVGAGKTATVLLSSYDVGSLGNLKNLTVKNATCTDFAYGDNRVVIWDNVRFETDTINNNAYLANFCYQYTGIDLTLNKCDFVYTNPVYMAVYAPEANYVSIKECTFNGNAWHHIRINTPKAGARIEVSNNVLTGGTTGIFMGSSRVRAIENVLIENNRLYGQLEESIALDGFGNNSGLCPVICNGSITSKTNDSSGRLVIGLTMTYATNNSGAQSTYTVGSRADWTSFFLSLGEGSGQEGVYAKIVAFDQANNTLTCDLLTLAASVTLGGDCGVQSGFFNSTIRNNVITGTVGAGGNNGCAISVYLNVFGTKVENNTIIGCHQGILIAGGLMLSTYRTLAYNNQVKGNTLLNCGQVAGGYPTVRFESLYGTHNQYNNQFVNNTVIGGRLNFERQQDFILSDNIIKNATTTLKYLGNTLPTVDSSQLGRTFMQITDDASGNPTTIEYYVCKLSGGTYTWVAV